MLQEYIDLINEYGIDVREYDVVDLKIIMQKIQQLVIKLQVEKNK